MLLNELDSFNEAHGKSQKISINTAVLKVICEGLKASPKLNSHIKYNRRLLSGHVEEKKHIDVSMPITFDQDKMMTVTLYHLEDKSMRQIQKQINNIRRKIKNTDMEAVQYRTGLDDTFDELRHGKIHKAFGRLLGAKIGNSKIKISRSRMKSSRKNATLGKSLSPRDIKQGSITVSNVGSIYREWNGSFTLLNIVPPQVCAISVGAMQEKPVVEDGEIKATKIIPLTIAVDHRAVDFNDAVPFMKRMDELLTDSNQITTLM